MTKTVLTIWFNHEMEIQSTLITMDERSLPLVKSGKQTLKSAIKNYYLQNKYYAKRYVK